MMRLNLQTEVQLWREVVVASLAPLSACEDTQRNYEHVFERADKAVEALRERLTEPKIPTRPTFAGDDDG